MEPESEEYQDYDEGYDDYDMDEHPQLKRLESKQEPSQDILFQRTNTYYIMDPSRTQKYIQELINEVQETFGVSEGLALKILHKYGWQKEKAFDKVTDEINTYLLKRSSSEYNKKEFDCPICFSTEPMEKACSFGCDHYYCQDCFLTYLKVAIEDKEALKACPVKGCPEILTPTLCRKYFGENSNLYKKYHQFLFQAIIDKSVNMLWCPGNNCTNIIQLLKMTKGDQALLNIRCECGNSFCFACRDTAHRPIHCERFSKWLTMIGGKDDSLNINWMKKNSKRCPKCNINIEKNQGCMHMTCRSCTHHFCWLCLGDWSQHGTETGGYYNCNKYKPSEETLDEGEREYEKFNFYRDRYEEHWNSLKHALKKKQVILNNFKNLNFEVALQKDDTFLKEAMDLIIEARRAITMTYALGYFAKFDSMGKDIYEMQQSLLWAALDNLDKFTDPLEKSESMQGSLVDIIQEQKHFSNNFNKYKLTLNTITAGVIAACNKLLKSLESDFKEGQGSAVKPKPKEFEDQEFYLQSDDEDMSDWYCAFCTFLNGKLETKCTACGNVKTLHEGDIY